MVVIVFDDGGVFRPVLTSTTFGGPCDGVWRPVKTVGEVTVVGVFRTLEDDWPSSTLTGLTALWPAGVFVLRSAPLTCLVVVDDSTGGVLR